LGKLEPSKDIYKTSGFLSFSQLKFVRCFSFILKNLDLFSIYAPIVATCMSDDLRYLVPDWRKFHSRHQSPYILTKIFNKMAKVVGIQREFTFRKNVKKIKEYASTQI